jgi:hypothetical protein
MAIKKKSIANILSTKEEVELLTLLEKRFAANRNRHPKLTWTAVRNTLEQRTDCLWSLHQMEITGGEPDVVGYDEKTKNFLFMDCSAETPKGRRSLCYDKEGLESRKDFPPAGNAIDTAKEMGITLLTEEEYRYLQQFGPLDSKTSSWLLTPEAIRKHGGALFGDYRYAHVFIYHNGAQSYYAGRGFRGVLRV